MSELRLYCLMRADLNAPVGKLMAQAGHAFLGCISFADRDIGDAYWHKGSQPKIVLKVDNLEMLARANKECVEAEIVTYVVKDEGRTIFKEPTITCLGVGPVEREKLPIFIQKLPLY